jgi:hypothetical protein
MVSPIVAQPDPRGPWFEQTWICTMSGSFHVNLNFPGSVVLEKKIFKDFSYINTCKNGFPNCGPVRPPGARPPGAMIWTNLNLHYVRKLPYKFELSWLSDSWEEDFYTFSLYKHMKKWFHLLWPRPTPGGHNFHNFVSTLHEDAYI